MKLQRRKVQLERKREAGGPAAGGAAAAEGAAARTGREVAAPGRLRVGATLRHSRRQRLYARVEARRCAMPATPFRRSACAGPPDAPGSALRRARSSPTFSPMRVAAYSGISSIRRPASATRWPMIGPSARADSFSTNQGSVCASSFSVPPSSTSPASVTNSFHRLGSAQERGHVERRQRQDQVGRRAGERRAFQRAAVVDLESGRQRSDANHERAAGMRGQPLARPRLARKHRD